MRKHKPSQAAGGRWVATPSGISNCRQRAIWIRPAQRKEPIRTHATAHTVEALSAMTRSGGDEAGWPALRSHPCSVFSSEVVSEQLKRYASVTAPNSERISESPPPARAAGLGNRALNAVGCWSMPNTEDRSTLSANDRYLREAADWTRREAVVKGGDGGRRG